MLSPCGVQVPRDARVEPAGAARAADIGISTCRQLAIPQPTNTQADRLAQVDDKQVRAWIARQGVNSERGCTFGRFQHSWYDDTMSVELPQIRTGHFEHSAGMHDYRLEWLGAMLVERVIYAVPLSGWLAGATLCYRFWLAAHDQVVERYFRPDGAPAGTKIDLCAPFACDESGCVADDYLLDIHVTPMGEVTVHHEMDFEQAIREGRLNAAAAIHAEQHLRRLTAAIARGRFPPPIVRNWRVDPSRLP